MIVAGCGYSGTRLAESLIAERQAVLGLVSRETSRKKLAALGIPVAVWDLDSDAAPPAMDPGQAIAYLVPPPPLGDDDPRIAAFLQRLTMRPTRFVYASTTGVYGNRGGDRVDETTVPTPETARARRRLAAENRVVRWCQRNNLPWVILRVPGIYGPQRLQLATVAAGRPLLRPELAGPGNRIHVDDLVSCLCAALATPNTNRIVNLGDGDHSSNTEFVMEVARQTGMPALPLADLDAMRAASSPARWSFMRESRRVDTTRMREELGVVPRYPRMREGIAASLAQMSRQ